MLWSTTLGAGLSLHRIRIGGGQTSETSIAQAAVARGVTIWATPWEVKGSDIAGNPPKLINAQDWANTLVSFVTTMKNAGVPIYAVSAENEPDSQGLNGTTSYSGDELASWIGSTMGPTLAPTGTKIMAPETMGWYGIGNYLKSLQANKAAWDHVDIVATHEYGGDPKAYPEVAAAGKEFWETEIYDTDNTPDDGMGSGLRIAAIIHDALTVANMNAWHYWWVWASGNGGLFNTDTKVWSKRLWVMGNFSRFVRPGYKRVDTSGNVPANVLVTAYVNPADDALAIVAVNKNNSPAEVSFYISDHVPCSLTPYETSAAQNIGQGPDIAVSDSRVTVKLAAQSVTTFVGSPSGGPPSGSASLVGCYGDGMTRDLPHSAYEGSGTATVESCISTCRTAGYKYAGAQDANQCFCGDSYGSYGKSDACKLACSGNSGETCGGIWANSVYATGN